MNWKKIFLIIIITAVIGIPYNLMCKDEQFLEVNRNWV